MDLRERLKQAIIEGLESSKNIIDDNIVPNFDEMGMANVKPGEFAQGEITDQENLVNKGMMSNDTEFNKDETPLVQADVHSAEVNISAPEKGEAEIEIVKKSEDECEDPLAAFFGESAVGKALKEQLNGRSFEQYLAEAGDYAGPLSYVPDVRINVSDVLNTLKHELGDGSEGIHVDQIYDERHNNAYKVSQYDVDKLPKKIQVQNVVLERDGDTYKVNKVSETYPLAK